MAMDPMEVETMFQMGRKELFSLLDATTVLPLLQQQSLCHQESDFLTAGMTTTRTISATSTNATRNSTSTAVLGSEQQLIHKHQEHLLSVWTHRLIYLAIHFHQHRHAFAEAKARRRLNSDHNAEQDDSSCHRAKLEEQYGRIGNFDFSCPDSKFFVASLPTRGLGSVLRVTAANALLAGIAENRTVLFLNNILNRSNNASLLLSPSLRIMEPWDNVSCDRKDFQCLFQPVSPCVLTLESLETAHVLHQVRPASPRRISMFQGARDLEHENDRVVILNLQDNLRDFVDGKTKARLMEVATELLQFLDLPLLPLLADPKLSMFFQKVIERIGQDDSRGWKHHPYSRSRSPIQRGILLYLMRPNAVTAKELDRIRLANKREGRHEEELDSSMTVGLPIRGTFFILYF
jgi:hypothetical protein